MPEYSPVHLKVCVHETYEKLQAARTDKKYGCEAFFRPTSVTEILHISPDGSERREVNTCFGEIHFYPKSLTFGIIAHEIFHAVIAWAWENGQLPPGNEKSPVKLDCFLRKSNEEMCAELMTVLVGQMMVGLVRTVGRKFLTEAAIQ